MVSIALSFQGEAFTEFESWWAPCLAGDVVLLGLWKAVTNLLLEGMNLFNRSGYVRFMFVEGIFTLCCNLVNLLLLDRRCLGQGCSGCSIILLTFWTNCEEAEFCSMRYYLGTNVCNRWIESSAPSFFFSSAMGGFLGEQERLSFRETISRPNFLYSDLIGDMHWKTIKSSLLWYHWSWLFFRTKWSGNITMKYT